MSPGDRPGASGRRAAFIAMKALGGVAAALGALSVLVWLYDPVSHGLPGRAPRLTPVEMLPYAAVAVLGVVAFVGADRRLRLEAKDAA